MQSYTLKNIHKNWYILFTIYFVLLFVANLIFPVTFDWHGRYISHTLLRIILQSGFQDLIVALLGAIFPFLAYFFVSTSYLINYQKKDLYCFIMFSSLLYAFVQASWSIYGMTTYFMSNIFSQMVMLLFLYPYFKFIQNPDYKPHSAYLIIIGIIAGSMHEQGVIALPLLIIIAGIHIIIQKRKIPLWFMIGFCAYLGGTLLLFLAPSTLLENRLLTYGNAQNWEFRGQTYNWMDLGIKRYWYSLLNWLIFVKNGSAYFPSSFAYIIFWIYITYKNIKEYSYKDPKVLCSIILMIASFGSVSAMMFSPLYYHANLNFGLIYLFIALTLAYRQYIENHHKHYKVLPRLACSIAGVIYILCFLSWNHYRIEYNHVVFKIEEAKEQNLSKVVVPAFTQLAIPTPFGNIYPVYLYRTPTFYYRMADYYQSPPIIAQGE